jgi:uncharacterized linocin/CFP29 family protein
MTRELVASALVGIGYTSHDVVEVQRYLEETFSFRVATPEVALAFTRPPARAHREAKPRA